MIGEVDYTPLSLIVLFQMTFMLDLVKMASNKSLQATRDGVSSSAFADHVINPACLSFGR